MGKIKKIMAVNRSTKHCNRVTGFGISLAQKFDASLSVIQVVHDPFSLTGWNLPISSLEAELKEEMENAKKELDKCLEDERCKGQEIKTIVSGESPVKAIIDAVKEEKIDLLLLPSHEEGRIEHFLFGRTNEELARKMPCHIFLMKSKPEPDSR